MKHIFYFLAIGPILWELYCVGNTRKVAEYHKKIKPIKWDDGDSTYKSFMLCLLVYLVWCFIGLFSEQWPSFAAIFVLGFVIPKRFLFLRWVDSVLTVAVLFFILLNAYHFHIDVLAYFKTLI